MNASSNERPDVVRRRVLISGRVQGVGYRESCRREARAALVAGWVENRADGTVMATFEGIRANVDHMISWCRNGPAAARVRSIYVSEEVPLGDVEDFLIKRPGLS